MKNLFAAFILSLFLVSCISSPEKNCNVSQKGNRIAVPSGTAKSIAGSFISIKSSWAREQSEVFVNASDKALNLEFRCYGKPENTVYSPKKADDDMTLFGGEHIEFVLSPNGLKDGIYYHFAVNPSGSVYHAKIRDTAWTPKDFKCEISDFKDHRLYKIELPWQIFGMQNKPADGTVWKANFCRADKGKKNAIEFSSWTGATSYHDINQMGDLVFGAKNDAALRVFECNYLSCTAAASEKGNFKLQMLINGNKRLEKSITDKPQKFKAKAAKSYIALKNMDNITLRLLKNNSIVWEKTVAASSSTVDFILPDKFEYLKNSDFKCKFAAFPGTLTFKNDEKTFAQHNIRNSSASVSLKGLSAGRYVAEYVSKNHRSSRVFFIIDQAPAKPVPLKQYSELTAQNTDLLLNGEPFYLLGISGGTKTYFPFDPGFTLAYGKGFRKNAFGYQGIPGKRIVRKPSTGYAFNYDWHQRVAKHFSQQRKNSRNVWRTLCYEANLNVFFTQKDKSLKLDPAGYKIYGQIYKMAKNAMPDKLFSIHADNMILLPRYVNYCDVMEFSSWHSSYHNSNLLLNQSDDMKFVRSHVRNKPIVMWLGGSIPNGHCRSAEELRGGVYNTIINGGAGNIIHMGHGGVPAHRTRFWSMLSMLQREVDSFYPELKKGTPFELTLPDNFVGKAVRTKSDELMLVILNKAPFEQPLELNIPQYEQKKMNFTPFEPRVIRLHKK